MPTPDAPGNRLGGSLLTIDLGAVQSNYRYLASVASGAECAAVVKADGYGLGAARVGPALSKAGCRTFFVAHLEEAVDLRAVLHKETIYCLNGLFPGEAETFAEYRICPVLNDLGQIEEWARYCAAGLPTPTAALQLDTGMSRLGLMPSEIQRLVLESQRLAAVKVSFIISHLACSDMPDHPLNKQQLDAFRALTAGLPAAKRSLAASSGIFLGPAWHFDMVRPGASLYGISPNSQKANPLKQVINLQGRILSIRDVDTPQTVGYGATRRFTGPTRVATVAAGYADGYPRSLGNQGSAQIGKISVPVIGRVSMDLITLDISEAPHVVPGDMVELVGPHHDADALAEQCGTIGYEILTRLGKRYHRHYIEGAA